MNYQLNYNNFYPKDVIYKEDEIVLTFHLGEEDEYIKKIIQNEKLFKELSKKIYGLTLRKKEKKLFLDCKISLEEIKKHPIFFDLYYLYEFIFNSNSILIKFKNNLTFEKFATMNFDEIFSILSSFVFILKGNFKNIDNSLKLLEQQKEDGCLKAIIHTLKSIIHALMTNNIMSFKFDISKDKLIGFLKLTSAETLDQFVTNIKMLMKIGISFLNSFFFYMFEKELNYDKILFTIMSSKYKSGFVLTINSKGINNFFNEYQYK